MLCMFDDFKCVEWFFGMSLLFYFINFIIVVFSGVLLFMFKVMFVEIVIVGEKLCVIEWVKFVKDVDGKDFNIFADRFNGRCFDVAFV